MEVEIIPDGVICSDRIEPEEPFRTLIFLLLIRKSHNANPPVNIYIQKMVSNILRWIDIWI